MKKRILCIVLCLATLLSCSALIGCSSEDGTTDGGTTAPDAFVIMTESLDGLFNPFFATSANDSTIVAMTQLGMLTTGYENGEVSVAYGDGEAVVVKDYSIVHNDNNTTTYTFVIKNNIKFSDGHPLTMEDVLFNMYVYLDPVYTGSSTMYSTDIVGLKDYRTQTLGGSNNDDDALNSAAAGRAQDRLKELINLYRQVGATSTPGAYSADAAKMIAAIQAHTLSSGYKKAVSADINSVTDAQFQAQLKADYDLALQLFREELERDYAGAKEQFTQEPYKSHPEFQDEVFCFMFLEGYVQVEYARDAEGKYDKTKIEKLTPQYNTSVVNSKAAAIDYVYTQESENGLDRILTAWATATELMTRYTAKAKEVILEEKTAGGLTVPNISGIVSLGHTTSTTSVTIGSNTYTVAQQHNADGTPVNSNEYDVLQITINGVDPKAIWNFAFAVAPQHYYAAGYTVDIANNKFGVDYGSFDYMRDVIQSTRNIKLPMGAGAYKVTDRDNSDTPNEDAFFSNNVVYFKRNDSFLMGQPKIEKIRYRVVSASNAIAALKEGSVHYISPQYTQYNIDELNKMASSGIVKMSTDQLGYGYIGINAGKVPNINIRKAIMCAMDTSLALSYYSVGTAENIYWSMSTVSWAYPKDELGNNDRLNDHDYPAVSFNKEAAKQKIQEYMDAAGVSAGDSLLTLKFTIAGADLTDHPTYLVFRQAAELLNEMGWNIQVVPDTQALTKLTTGSLSVWAAAWGSTVDPDMYQVYHKNSTATSVLAWGYREILANPSKYVEENAILNVLSAVIDEARETEDREERTELYKEAMGYVLDLAVELPVYQRDVLYAYNSKVIKSSSMPSEINPYTSPLDKIWEIEFAA